MPRENYDNELDYVRGLVADLVWSIGYHEDGLRKAHVTLGLVKGAIIKGFPDINLDDYEGEDMEKEEAETPNEYIGACYSDAVSSVTHHENGLRNAHRNLAFAIAVARRCNYDLDIDEIKREQAAKAQARLAAAQNEREG
jgi:hypothetical protein